ncbi:uncharacterized protein EMH_0027020 [Eimeria mitis]|uniref:Cytidyltransferase-like domain-containing protein n=1 Tax=Eimeria mitis TaxID=44415 RepID=U6K1K7_9EIME|nr:uncharacterized protein EMH_0027020 [Eimeria mitis]CDJ30202.1 hypothetical protein, conserved [Eimeria mitis]
MASATSCCFQEDAACVIIDEKTVRRLALAGTDCSTKRCVESCEVDELVIFLCRALLLTRRTLYVLLCVPTEARSTPSLRLSNESHSGDRGGRFGDAATFVSCGVEAWRLIVCLHTRVGSLARRFGLTAVPIIIPWDCATSRAGVPADGSTPACTHWVERARAAVLHHYRQTSGGSFSWQPVDEAGLANAVPLVLDNVTAFSSCVACDIWPRHCHLSPFQGNIRVCSSDQALLVEVEEQSISQVQQSALLIRENPCDVKSNGASQGVCEDRSGDTATDDEKVQAQVPFGYTVVAGTFDRLHAGHQLLLAAAVLSARQRIGLAVASGPLVKKKTMSQQDMAAAGIEPFAFRLQAAAALVQLLAASQGKETRVAGFIEALEEEEASMSNELHHHLSLLGGSSRVNCGFRGVIESPTSALADTFGGSVQLQVFRIIDAVGPADKLAFDCLVVSAETLKGAIAVNSIRIEAGNKPVFVLTVGLVPTDAWVAHQAAEKLAAYFPFPLCSGVNQFEQKSGICVLTGEENGPESTMPANARAPSKGEEHSSVQQEDHNPTAGSLEVFPDKLSSTALRQLQRKRLRCGSVADLCKRFHAAWLWLEGREGETGTTELQSCSTMWSILCAEHATPWRRLHTFDRVARALELLDASKPSVNREPVVLTVFFGSLLACPCHYITLGRGACTACDSRVLTTADCANTCTIPSWSPEAEDAAWHRSAVKLLAELQRKWGRCSFAAAQNSQRYTRKVPAASTFVYGDTLLEGRFSLLMGLLLEHRAASLTRLAPTAQAVNALRGRRDVSRDDEETATMVLLARRLGQLEFTDRSVEEKTRLRRLRQEYFFVSEDCFRRYRMMQVAHLLENANSLDCLNHEELFHARVSLERELSILETQSLHDEPSTCL